MNTLKIDTWRNADKSALIQAGFSVLFCVVYTHVIMLLTGGEEFVGKDITQETISGIRHDVVLAVCGILEAIIPIIFLRYSAVKFLCLNIFLTAMYYLIIMFTYVCIIDCWNIFDLITFAVIPVPIGYFAGVLVSILINSIKSRKSC